MLNALDVSTSALVAERTRLTAVANNLANLNSTRNEKGEVEPYKPRYVLFQTDESIGGNGAAGVRVARTVVSDQPPRLRWDPHHPDAVKQGKYKGYVRVPDINMMTEMVDAMEAARAYEANLGAIEIAKDMTNQSLRILA